MNDDGRIFLGLGSNVNNRYLNIIGAIKLLNSHPHLWVLKKSYIYITEPMYNSKQKEFYNMVLEIATNLNPLELLETIKKIEKKIGRTNGTIPNMPREIDIDILAFGELIINSKVLKLPHSKISERKFVLKPWVDIAPDFKIPKINKKVNELLNKLDDSYSIKMLLITD